MIPLCRLTDVRATGDIVWFQRALDRLRALPHETDPRLRAFFSGDSAIYVARAPGRLDVMGGIADYSGARVLELPLECATAALLQWQGTPRCAIAPARGGRGPLLSLSLPLRTPDELAAPVAGRGTGR